MPKRTKAVGARLITCCATAGDERRASMEEPRDQLGCAQCDPRRDRAGERGLTCARLQTRIRSSGGRTPITARVRPIPRNMPQQMVRSAISSSANARAAAPRTRRPSRDGRSRTARRTRRRAVRDRSAPCSCASSRPRSRSRRRCRPARRRARGVAADRAVVDQRDRPAGRLALAQRELGVAVDGLGERAHADGHLRAVQRPVDVLAETFVGNRDPCHAPTIPARVDRHTAAPRR